MKVFVTSDLHFCHDKDFLYEPRGFKSVKEMNEAIIANWNSVVGTDDEVYVLGDMMLNDEVEGLNCISRLNGRIHIAAGNHDTIKKIALYHFCPNVVEVEPAYRFQYKKISFYLTHYPTLCGVFDSGRPMREHTINLCGHSHTWNAFKDMWEHKAFIYHCELDAHAMMPVLFDDIIKDIAGEILDVYQYMDDVLHCRVEGNIGFDWPTKEEIQYRINDVKGVLKKYEESEDKK